MSFNFSNWGYALSACKKGDLLNFNKYFSKLNEADINKKNNNGESLFLEACKGNNIDIVKILLANPLLKFGKIEFYAIWGPGNKKQFFHDIQGDNNNTTPLEHAVKTGITDIINILLNDQRIKENIDCIDNKYNTAFHYVCQFLNIELLEMFLKIPNVNFVSEGEGRKNPLEMALSAGSRTNVEKQIKASFINRLLTKLPGNVYTGIMIKNERVKILKNYLGNKIKIPNTSIVKTGGNKKKIHIGSRGGKYYIKDGKKIYVK